MGRVIIAAGAAFALFLLAGTGVGILRARQAQAAASLADTVATASTDTAAVDGADVDSLSAPAGEPMERDAIVPTEAGRGAGPAQSDNATRSAALPMPTTLPRRDVDAADPGLSADEPQQGRVAKLFAAMSPRDAAKVLEHMSDHDVITVLGRLPERRAGEILAVMAAPRSASLTRSMLLSTPAPQL